jgi:hypothetical protein
VVRAAGRSKRRRHKAPSATRPSPTTRSTGKSLPAPVNAKGVPDDASGEVLAAEVTGALVVVVDPALEDGDVVVVVDAQLGAAVVVVVEAGVVVVVVEVVDVVDVVDVVEEVEVVEVDVVEEVEVVEVVELVEVVEVDVVGQLGVVVEVVEVVEEDVVVWSGLTVTLQQGESEMLEIWSSVALVSDAYDQDARTSNEEGLPIHDGGKPTV